VDLVGVDVLAVALLTVGVGEQDDAVRVEGLKGVVDRFDRIAFRGI